MCYDTAGLIATSIGNSSTGAGANVVRLDVAAGSMNVSVSGGNGNDNQVAASFALGTMSMNVGWDQGNASGTATSHIAIATDVGAANVKILAARVGTSTNYILSGSGAVGSGSLYGFVGQVGGSSVYGVNYGQSLGGGANASVGLESHATAGTNWAAGVTFSF